jgi:hypothetical protein
VSRFSLAGLVTGASLTFSDDPSFECRPVTRLLMLDMLSGDLPHPSQNRWETVNG